MKGKANGKTTDANSTRKRNALRLMLIDAQREAESLKLGLTCYLLGMAIQSVDLPEQAVPKGVMTKAEMPIAAT